MGAQTHPDQKDQNDDEAQPESNERRPQSPNSGGRAGTKEADERADQQPAPQESGCRGQETPLEFGKLRSRPRRLHHGAIMAQDAESARA